MEYFYFRNSINSGMIKRRPERRIESGHENHDSAGNALAGRPAARSGNTVDSRSRYRVLNADGYQGLPELIPA